MPQIPIVFKPGVDAQSTAALNAASWNESENVRFFQGLAQKSGGFSGYTEQVANAGRPSALRAWTALSGIANLAMASSNYVSLFASDAVANITPLTKIAFLPVDLSTTAGETTVTVEDALNSPQEGDWFQFLAPVAVGGIVLEGAYRVDTVVDPTHFTIEAAVEAASTVVSGGAPRQFDTTNGSPTVTVTLTNHGLFTGQVIYLRSLTAVGGLGLRGNYVVTVLTPDTYTIDAGADATSTQTAMEYGGNMVLSFLTGLIQAASATVEPYDTEASHVFRVTGAIVIPYVSGGTLTYAPGNQLTVNQGAGSKPVLLVDTTQVVVVTVVNVGSGGSPGAHTFRGSDGTGTAFEFTATVAADGTLTGAVPAISVPGSYTVNPTLVGQGINDLTDGTLVGATVSVGMWPNTLSIDPDHKGAMTDLPDNPVEVINSGTGRGATVDIGWDFGYLLLDILSLVGGFGDEPKFQILTTTVVRVAIQDGGSGGPAGSTHTFRGSDGTGTPFEFTCLIAPDGSLTAQDDTIVITVPGGYTISPTLFDEPVNDITDGSLTGATVNISMWPATVSLSSAGHMTSVPNNPAATTDDGPGDGTGAQLNVTWDYSQGAQNLLGYEYWILDNWGEFLVAIPSQGPVYVWQPKRGATSPLEDVGSAPQANLGGFVASQQQILVLLGTVNFVTDNFDPMLIRWSTVGDYTDFAPSSVNLAGSQRLQIGSRIVAGTASPRGNLVWTDLALYAMQFQGLPFVFTIQPISQNCGLIGPHAFGTMGDGTTFWQSQNQFYMVTVGGAAQPIPCSIWDFVFPQRDPALVHLVTCATNSYYGEVSWWVPQLDGSVTIARLQVQSGVWDYTVVDVDSIFDRAAWVDQNVFGAPLGIDPSGNVYRQETTRDADGAVLPTRLLSGITQIGDGQEYLQISHITPDIKFDEKEPTGPGTLNMRIWLYKDPQAPPRVKGPYPINARTRRIPCRGRAKGLQFEFYSDDLQSWWRLGRVVVDAFPDGQGG